MIRSMPCEPAPWPQGAAHLPAALDAMSQAALLAEVRQIIAEAPLYRPQMPRSGRPFSVLMTNCGTLGWVSDRSGYRYQEAHPQTGRRWPAIPQSLLQTWQRLTAYPELPEACLINYYAAAAKLGSHRDADEEDVAAPVLSISLGDTASFHVGGLARGDPKASRLLHSGDIVILGGPARMAYHGIDRIESGTSGLLAEGGRFNLTLRRVHRPLPCRPAY